jgi:restriction system protein
LGQHNLGSFYRYGRGGLPKDDQEAARLFKPAADQGNAWAKAQLASFEAARLYKLVADQGSPWVQRQAEEFFPPLGKLVWCPHGVFAGQYGNRCGKCVHEQKEIEEKQRRERELLERQQQIERELQERQQRINAAAESLQRDERSRLASSLIPSIEELRSISPQDFEDEIARMFERLGYEVKQTPYVNDHGRDAILVKDGKKFLLECKRYGEGNVSGRRDLQILHSNIIKDRAVAALVVTTGGFTKNALEFAHGHSIKAVDGSQLVRMMFESKNDPSKDDSYDSMCRKCCAIVRHQLRTPEPLTCPNGHVVEPTLNMPACIKCGTPMRLINGKRGRFWGCSRYPECRSTRNYGSSGRARTFRR